MSYPNSFRYRSIFAPKPSVLGYRLKALVITLARKPKEYLLGQRFRRKCGIPGPKCGTPRNHRLHGPLALHPEPPRYNEIARKKPKKIGKTTKNDDEKGKTTKCQNARRKSRKIRESKRSDNGSPTGYIMFTASASAIFLVISVTNSGVNRCLATKSWT